jgi:capsular polysaccharide biosynthesis protein
MQIEINELRQRIETKKQEEARLPTVIAAYQKKVEAAPALESELTELNRDYATLEDSYTDLLKKSEQSKIASNLERRQIGEQFKILDGARLPEKPFSPNRLRINIIGILAGLALGVALIALLEYRDTTFKTDDDIVISLALPVLAVIPAMITTGERRRAQRRRLVMALSGSFVLVVAIAAVVAWRLRLLEAWVR